MTHDDHNDDKRQRYRRRASQQRIARCPIYAAGDITSYFETNRNETHQDMLQL